MVYKRSTKKTKRPYRRRATTVRPYRRMMKKRMTPTSTFVTKRINYVGNWTFSTALTTGFWRYFTVSMQNYNNFAEMATLFDEYKVNAVKLTLRPRYDNVDASATASFPQAYLHYIVDPGTTLIPSGVYNLATMNTFLENNDVKTRVLTKPVSIYFKPKVSEQLFGGGTATRVKDGGWIKTDQASVDFRGIHLFLQGNNFTNVGSSVQLDQYVTFYCSFRSPK